MQKINNGFECQGENLHMQNYMNKNGNVEIVFMLSIHVLTTQVQPLAAEVDLFKLQWIS